MKELIPSLRLRILLYVIGVVAAEFLVFHAGMVVGSERRFGPGEDRQWGFHAPMMGDVRMPHGFMLSGHGVVGVIEEATPSSIIIKSRDGALETVSIASTTVISPAGTDETSTTTKALVAGTHVVILGRPGSGGSIDADFIRIMSGPVVPTN